jgi:hypothetical protein
MRAGTRERQSASAAGRAGRSGRGRHPTSRGPTRLCPGADFTSPRSLGRAGAAAPPAERVRVEVFGTNSRRLMSTSTAICLRRSLAHRQMLFAHTNLNDTRLVHSSDTDVLEYLVIDLAPPRLLDDDLLTAVNQRPEGRRLRLLRSIAAERKVNAGVCKISVTSSIRNPKFLDCGVRRNVCQHSVYLLGRHADLLS